MKTSMDFETIAKKSKRKQLWKTVSLSIIGALALGVVIAKGMTELTSYHGNRVKDDYLLRSQIAYPNVQYKSWYFNPTSTTTGNFTSDRFKNINGITVPYETYEANYSMWRNGDTTEADWIFQESDGSPAYTMKENYKSPMFYNTNFRSEGKNHKVAKEIDIAKDMQGQAIEVAITFDKPYTYKELAKKLPKNLMLNWLWIGTSSNFDVSTLPPSDQLGLFANNSLSQEDLNFFSTNLNKAIKDGMFAKTYGTTTEGKSSYHFNLETDAKDYLKNNQDIDNATFSGAILTGRAENFAQLASEDWIFASSIGQSVTIQPYHQLSK
ncbi:anti sigma factor C-terminal domain-containing protein [Streptococcus pluranimalium]